jgi:hypothetical protein
LGIDKEVKINLMANEHQARKKRLKSWAMLLAALLSILAAMIYVHNYYEQRLQVLALENQRLKEERDEVLSAEGEDLRWNYLQLKSNSVQRARQSQASIPDLQDDPTQTINDDLKQMIEDRKPRVTLALSVFNMLDQPELIEKYFHKKYSEKQMDVISIEGSLRLIFSLVEAEGLDPEADHQKRMDDISAIIAEHFDFIEQILEDMGQWPK